MERKKSLVNEESGKVVCKSCLFVGLGIAEAKGFGNDCPAAGAVRELHI